MHAFIYNCFDSNLVLYLDQMQSMVVIIVEDEEQRSLTGNLMEAFKILKGLDKVNKKKIFPLLKGWRIKRDIFKGNSKRRMTWRKVFSSLRAYVKEYTAWKDSVSKRKFDSYLKGKKHARPWGKSKQIKLTTILVQKALHALLGLNDLFVPYNDYMIC